MHEQNGTANPSTITAILLGLLAVLLGGFGIWTYLNYIDQKDNVDAKIKDAVVVAQELQKKEDEAAFAEREKSPVRGFTGPQDLGRITFDYPKTWSVFIGEDGSKGSYEGYFNPGLVEAPAKKMPNSLRLSIVEKDYDTVLKSYQADVSKGDLKASAVNVSGQNGVRLDGAFSSTVKGAMVLLKLRDKTIQVYTESEDYLNDFNNIILPSFKYNP